MSTPNMTTFPQFSPLVATEFGIGFLNPVTRELRTATFAVHVSPPPARIRAATSSEATEFFAHRSAHRAEMVRFYDRKTSSGHYAYQGD